jgi:hypothetical protein
VALAEAHGMSLESLELDPLAVRQVVVKRRGGIGPDRVEDRHALIGIVVGQTGAFGRTEGIEVLTLRAGGTTSVTFGGARLPPLRKAPNAAQPAGAQEHYHPTPLTPHH